MTGILTTAKLTCKSPEARETVIDAFRKIIAFTAPNEPEVLQYICALPIEDNLKTEIYMIEEYTSQAASDAHLATQPVQDLIKLFTTSDVLGGAPEVHNSTVASKHTSDSPLPVTSNPAIVLVNVGYKAGSTASVLSGWKSTGERALSSVKGFNVFTVAEDKESNSVRAVYVLDGWKSFEEFQSLGVGDRTEKDRTGVAEAVKIRAVDGFVKREGRSKL
ncbi:Nn.00g003560.m01.CDS01 [Neocucurbitaria sp. VM-36]